MTPSSSNNTEPFRQAGDQILKLSFNRSRHFSLLAGSLFALIALMALLDFSIAYYWRSSFPPLVISFFNLSSSGSIGTFAATLLYVLAGGCFLVLSSPPEGEDFPLFRKRRLYWLGMIFCFLSLDEATGLHERLGIMFGKLTARGAGMGLPEWEFLSRLPVSGWHFVYGPLIGAMAVLLLWIVWKDIESSVPRRLLVATFCCYLASVGIGFAEKLFSVEKPVLDMMQATLEDRLHPHGMHVIEETLKLTGTATALLCSVALLSSRRRRIVLAFDSSD